MPGQALSAPGWFGKVVMLGDFAHRRLTPGVVATCDAWLSAGLSASRAGLGDDWLATYLGAPVWRFAWAPGVIDAQWWFGVLMPSVDAVGRYFPLLVAEAAPHPPADAAALARLARWWAAAGTAAQDTLRPGSSLDGFESALAGLPAWADGGQPTALDAADPADPARAAEAAEAAEADALGVCTAAYALALPLVVQRCAGHSLWLPFTTGTPAPRADLLPGLPTPDQFTRMLCGHPAPPA